jgi:predicted nucleotidyltransferase
MELARITTLVAHWAASEPVILRAWIFGSRVRGTSRDDSDVDIAIEVSTLPGDSSPFVTFIHEKKRLRGAIQACLKLEVDLQWYGGQVETPTIYAGLQQSSVLAYSKTS